MRDQLNPGAEERYQAKKLRELRQTQYDKHLALLNFLLLTDLLGRASTLADELISMRSEIFGERAEGPVGYGQALNAVYDDMHALGSEVAA